MAHARMWVIPFAGACASARCRVVILVDEQAVFEFLSSVIVDLWTRYVRNVAQQLTLDEQFVDAAMPSHLNVKRSLAL